MTQKIILLWSPWTESSSKGIIIKLSTIRGIASHSFWLKSNNVKKNSWWASRSLLYIRTNTERENKQKMWNDMTSAVSTYSNIWSENDTKNITYSPSTSFGVVILEVWLYLTVCRIAIVMGCILINAQRKDHI